MKEKNNLKNILIICLQGIGNTLMTLYAVEEFIRLNPATLSIVVSNNGSHEVAVSEFPESKVYVWDESKGVAKNIVRLGCELRQRRFDAVYLAYPSGKRESIIGLLARAKEKRVLMYGSGDWKSFKTFYKRKIVKPFKMHDINADLLLFGMPKQGYVDLSNKLVETTKINHGDYAEKVFRINDLSDKFVVAVHPGAKGEGKRWDIEKFIRLCRELSKRFDCKFVVIGGNDELLLKQRMARGIGGGAILLDSPSLLQTGSVLRRCNLFIGNDSAPMHLSVALGVPVIALWSYTNFYDTSPYGPRNVIIRKAYNCSPCYSLLNSYVSDCKHSMRCIRSLALEEVIPVVCQYIEILLYEKRNVTAEDMNSLKMDYIEKIYKLDHGCIVIDLKV